MGKNILSNFAAWLDSVNAFGRNHARIILLGLLWVGGGLLIVGLVTPNYSDEEEFFRRYSELSSSQSKEYWALRDQFLTYSISCQDYGITALLLAAFISLAGVWRKIVSGTPKRVALSAGIIVTCSVAFIYTGSLLLDFYRGEFPRWADSLGIPLAGLPHILYPMTGWVLVHFGLLTKSKRCGWLGDIWLRAMIGVSALVVVLTVVTGDFWMLWLSAAWLGFYLSIVESRKPRMR